MRVNSMKKYGIIIMAFVLAITLSACGSKDKAKNTDKADKAQQEIKVSKDEKVPNDKPVADINNHKIYGKHYNSMYVQTKMQLAQYGQDINDKKAVKKQTLQELIAQELLRQDAKAKGVTVSDKEVDDELAKVKHQYQDQFNNYLKQFKLTEDGYKQQIKYSLILNKYLSKEFKNPKVTDKEVKDTFNKLKKQNKDLKFDEVKDSIKKSIVQQKQNAFLQDKLNDLQKDAKIKELI
ncbi:SurA N-terminal domain-containing protein [Virgibacillus sp. 179-BFC.A HS]|uniref:peptidylprolyl isomerase n=1 Tax=Tigheibacillus jepli TaxID=3035914 RepID=A0ABU5CMB2_9BACI|nr:SurA N-terminal domain-containing protein [Virgibacillus sp. 179-BFC.A HS]MDY0406962.1 SurA N-terminal domain-containing protein [Virgibacillus sp. 179-BFC.A HS]